MAKPWYTSSQLISAIKRKISFPTSSNTFTDDDLLAFANEEMMISQVPSVLLYHEEFFVASVIYPLRQDTNRYPIPKRAIGMRLRDVFWCDPAGNLFEMTRIQADDKAFFQRSIGANQAIHKFYIEGNDIVLTPSPVNSPSGSLVVYYFIRPNQLVTEDRAAIIEGFSTTMVVDNANITAGDTLTIESVNQNIYVQPSTPAQGGNIPFVENEFQDANVFANEPIVTTTTITAISGGSPTDNEFLIGATSAITATNIVNCLNALGVIEADNGSPATDTITFTYTNVQTKFTVTETTDDGMVMSSNMSVLCDDVSSIFTPGELVDFIQTDAGHQTLAIDVTIPSGGASGNTLTFPSYVISPSLVVGDYVCLAQECIIPQIPSDLHNGLAERTCARILAAIGDQTGLQATTGKIQEIDARQGTLLDQRVEGAPQKITGRHGLLRYFKTGVRRRV
jgi:hypothetical protein